MTCPSCGAEASGNFCSACGASLAPPVCRACRATLSAGAHFCHRCGQAVSGGPGASRTPWIIATSIIVMCIAGIVYGVVLRRSGGPATPDMANNGATGAARAEGAPPDISQMTPEERFIRLNDRVMSAANQGDTATALRFLPMALAAYGMLDQIDIDDRYHAAMLHVAAREYPAASALTDSIMTESPDNLLGWMARAALADAKGDPAGYARSRKAFLKAYTSQVRLNRPEYQAHQELLTQFRDSSAARGGQP
jgi:double zinc ribbon protein